MTGQTDKEIVIHHGLPTYTLVVNGISWRKTSWRTWQLLISLRGSYGLTATAGPATNSLAIYRSFITDRLNLGDRETDYRWWASKCRLNLGKQFETNIGLDLGIFNNSSIYYRCLQP
jgi:hypothetical protein